MKLACAWTYVGGGWGYVTNLTLAELDDLLTRKLPQARGLRVMVMR